MSKSNLGVLLGLVVLTIVSMSLTYSQPPLDNKHKNVKLMIDAVELVRERYVKPIGPERERQFYEDSLNGGLEKLDPYSGFMGVDEYKQFKKASEATFGGIGIRISMERGVVFVESPMVDTPAYNAGIQAGDIIKKIDGESTHDMTLKNVVDKIQGKPGTKLTLTVLHEGAKEEKDAVDIEITRAVINIDSVLGDERTLKEWNYWVDPQTRIAYVRITQFTEKTVGELTKVVAKLQKENMAGLVVDLRNNPGGLLQSAVEVSSMFLPEGKRVVTTKGRDSEIAYDSRRADPSVKQQSNYPLVILINRYSASASEIVAAALQDHLRAVIIGERSFGKGSVQNVIPMENGATALKLTTARYWRPSNRNIHRFPDSKETDDWGVMPNKGYEVKLTLEERIEYLKYRRARDIPKERRKADKEGAKKEPPDRMLEKAKDYIRAELQKRNGKPNALHQQQQPLEIPRPAEASDDPTEHLGMIRPLKADRSVILTAGHEFMIGPRSSLVTRLRKAA